MQNIFIYIISAILLFGVIALYAADLIDYGMDIVSAAAIIFAAVVVVIIAAIIIRALSKRLYDKDKNNFS